MSGAGTASGRVVVVGSLNVDLTVRTERFPQPGETLTGSELHTAPGGKSSNQAVAAATLGSDVRIVGALGDDDNGAFLLREAEDAGVDVSGVRRLDDHATGSAMIVVDASGENTIIVSPGANGALSDEAVTTALAGSVGEGDVLCLCLEVPVPVVLGAARTAQEAGARVVLNLSPYAEVPGELLAACDVLLVNRSEADLIVGAEGGVRGRAQDGGARSDETADPDAPSGPDWAEVLDRLVALGVRRAVVTCGADGSVVLDDRAGAESRVTTVEATVVDAVDTTGCGDAFTGAVAHRLARGSDLVEAARFASQVSALAATADGAQSSYRAFADRRE